MGSPRLLNFLSRQYRIKTELFASDIVVMKIILINKLIMMMATSPAAIVILAYSKLEVFIECFMRK